MDVNLIYFLVGIFATVLIGIIGIYISINLSKKVDFYLIDTSSFSLFSRVVKDHDELDIRYNGEKIENNLILYKGKFFNGSLEDVDSALIHKPLTLTLDKRFLWKKVIVSGKSDEIRISYNHNDHDLEFNWDTFKSGEYFGFEALIEIVGSQNEIEIEPLITHRITNVNEKCKRKFPLPPPSLKTNLISGIALLLIAFFFGRVSYNEIHERESFTYLKSYLEGEQHYVRAEYTLNKYINLIDTTETIIDVVNEEDFRRLQFLGDKRIILKPIDIGRFWVGIVMSIFMVILFIALVSLTMRRRMAYLQVEPAIQKNTGIIKSI